MSSIRRIPRFALKKIDPKEINKNYKDGKYEHIEIPKTKIDLSKVLHITKSVHGDTPQEHSYQFKDKNNLSVVV
ncbi:unnamed protein product, partial [marine sediment metagenome]